MDNGSELAALVALLEYGQHSQSWIRQQTMTGIMPSQIIRDDPKAATHLDCAVSDIGTWQTGGTTVLPWFDAKYPARLRKTRTFPLILFARGKIVPDDLGVCVIGSRNANTQDLEVARLITRQLVSERLTVVSGLARGVDRAAHREALTVKGRTVAVIGNGVDYYYPPENVRLQETIETRGLVMSQFWPGAKPSRGSFPTRNITMNGYGAGNIIVCASEDSGTRHQAKAAMVEGRPVVLMRPVYETTSWGRELADQSRLVAVADSANQAVDSLLTVLDGPVF